MAAPVATARTLNGVQDTPIDSDDAPYYRAKTGIVVPFGFAAAITAQISFVSQATRGEITLTTFNPQGLFVGAFVKPATRGDIDITGLTPVLSAVSWSTIPTINIDRTAAFPQYVPNIRATYLIDPGGLVTSVNVVDVNLGGISYDPITDRIVIASDPGSDTIDTVAMDATLGTSTDVTVTSFTLTNTTAGTLTNTPFTIGMPFRQGDIPNTIQPYITSSTLPNFEGIIRNRWPDGSVKFAVLSGRATLAPNTPLTVLVQKTSTAPSGSNITETNLTSISPQPAVSMSLGAIGSVSLVGRFGSPVRSILGTQMSEFHYRSAVGSDAHLTVWYYVRLYKDLGAGAPLEIETCVENGYMKVASPADQTYNATLIVNGTTRFSGSITHYQRTRWFTINWYDGTSGLTDFTRVIPSHAHAYLRASKMIPNYSTAATPTAAYLNSLFQTITPGSDGYYAGRGDLTATGAADHIGLMPRWEAAYFLSGDARAWKSVIANGYAGNQLQICYRDEDPARQRPLALTTRPNFQTLDGGLPAADIPTTGSPNANSHVYADAMFAHVPSLGYAAYLITGRWTFLETCAFAAARSHMHIIPTGRGSLVSNGGTATIPARAKDTNSYTRQDRQKAWHMRNVFQAAAAYPDAAATWMPAADALIRDNWITAIANTFTWMRDNWRVNNFGYVEDIFNTTDESPPAGTIVGKAWMHDFLVQAVGFGWDLGLSFSTAGSAHQLVRDYLYKWPIGRLSAAGTEWDYRVGPTYIVTMGTLTSITNKTWNTTFAQCLAQQIACPPLNYIPAVSGTAISGGNFPDATSYGGNMTPAIVYAVDHTGATIGAIAAYARMTGASNYATFVADQVNAQQWAVVPRP